MEGNSSDVSSPASSAGESNSNPNTESNTAAPAPATASADQSVDPGQRQGSDNPIPHWRVQQMISQAVEKERGQYRTLEGKLSEMQKQYGSLGENLLKGFGLYEEPKPEYVDKKHFEQTLQSSLQSLQQDWALKQEMARIDAQLEQAKAKYSEAFEFPGFEKAVLDTALQNPQAGVMSAVESTWKKYQGILAKKQQTYVADKVETQKTQVVRPGGAAPATEQKKPRNSAERIARVIARLQK